MNHLSNNFYTVPALALQTMTRRELQETVHATNGWITALGEVWDIQSHNIAGAYVVTLKKRRYT